MLSSYLYIRICSINMSLLKSYSSSLSPITQPSVELLNIVFKTLPSPFPVTPSGLTLTCYTCYMSACNWPLLNRNYHCPLPIMWGYTTLRSSPYWTPFTSISLNSFHLPSITLLKCYIHQDFSHSSSFAAASSFSPTLYFLPLLPRFPSPHCSSAFLFPSIQPSKIPLSVIHHKLFIAYYHTIFALYLCIYVIQPLLPKGAHAKVCSDQSTHYNHGNLPILIVQQGQYSWDRLGCKWQMRCSGLSEYHSASSWRFSEVYDAHEKTSPRIHSVNWCREVYVHKSTTYGKVAASNIAPTITNLHTRSHAHMHTHTHTHIQEDKTCLCKSVN